MGTCRQPVRAHIRPGGAPGLAATITYVALYFVQNVFEQPVYQTVTAVAGW